MLLLLATFLNPFTGHSLVYTHVSFLYKLLLQLKLSKMVFFYGL